MTPKTTQVASLRYLATRALLSLVIVVVAFLASATNPLSGLILPVTAQEQLCGTGPIEIATNGDFNTDAAGWTLGSTIAWSNGAGSDGNPGHIYLTNVSAGFSIQLNVDIFPYIGMPFQITYDEDEGQGAGWDQQSQSGITPNVGHTTVVPILTSGGDPFERPYRWDNFSFVIDVPRM